MTFQVTFKTPDALSEGCEEFGKEEARSKYGDGSEEQDEFESKLINKASAFAKKWVKWGEYVTLEFDMENNTVKVLEANKY